MAEKNYTNKLGIDVSEFTKAIKESNANLKVLAQQVNATRLSTVDYNTAVDSLTKNVKEHTNKQDALQKKYDKLKDVLGENAAQTKKVEAELEKEKNALIKAEIALKDYKDGLNNTSNSCKDVCHALTQMEMVIYDVAKAITKAACKALVDFTKETINTGMQFESAFAGVRKVTSGTEEDFKNLETEIRKTALEKPISADQLASIYQMGSQLGIAKDGLKDFSNAIIDLAKTSDLTEEAGATMIAQYANVTGLKEEEYRKFASTLSYLGSTTATTESTIMDFASRISGSAKLIGMSHQEILALSTALGSVGIKAEMGGSAISKIMNSIDVAVDKNSKELQTWAQVAGVSSSEFANKWKTNVSGAFQDVLAGMTKFKDEGGSLNLLLEELDIKNIRQTETLKKLANASQLLAEDMSKANTEWEKAMFLGESAGQVYNTVESQLQLLKNSFAEMQISIYDGLKEPLAEAAEELSKFLQSDDAKKFSEEFSNALKGIIKIVTELIKVLIKNFNIIVAVAKTAMAAISGLVAAKITKGFATLANNIKECATFIIKWIANLFTAKTAQDALTTSTVAAKVAQDGLNASMVANPIGAIATAIGLLISAIVMLALNTEKATDKTKEHTKALEEQNLKLDENRVARENAIKEIDHEYNGYERLIGELRTLVDENGKVKDGYQKRFNEIVPIIQNATGVEIKCIDGQIVKYNELIGTLDNVIKKKRAEARISAYEDDYKMAIKDVDKANKEYGEIQNKIRDLKVKRANVKEKYAEDPYSTSVLEAELNEEINTYQKQLDEINSIYTKSKSTMDEYEKMIGDYQNEFVTSSINNDTSNAGSAAGQAYVQGFSSVANEVGDTAKAAGKKVKEETKTTYQELLNQEKAYGDQLNDYLSKVKDANSGVTVEMVHDTKKKLDEVQKKVKDMKELLGDNTVSTKLVLDDETYGGLTKKRQELKDQLSQLQTELANGNQSITQEMLNNVGKQIDQIDAKIKNLKNEWDENGNDGEISDEFESENTNHVSKGVIFGKGVLGENAVEIEGAGKDAAGAYLDAFLKEKEDKKNQIAISAVEQANAEATNYQLATIDPNNLAIYDITERMLAESKQTSQAQGLTDNAYKVIDAETWTLNQAIEAAKQIDFTVIGRFMCEGIANGISANAHLVVSAVRSMMAEANSSAADEEEIESPSKVFYRFGKYMDLGLANGIRDCASEVSTQVRQMTSRANEAINLANSQMKSERLGTQQALIGAGPTEINYNFVQNNTSNKSLDTLAIYQESKSMLKRAVRNQYV